MNNKLTNISNITDISDINSILDKEERKNKAIFFGK